MKVLSRDEIRLLDGYVIGRNVLTEALRLMDAFSEKPQSPDTCPKGHPMWALKEVGYIGLATCYQCQICATVTNEIAAEKEAISRHFMAQIAKVETRLKQCVTTCATVYQWAGANDFPVEILDNLSIIAQGFKGPHEQFHDKLPIAENLKAKVEAEQQSKDIRAYKVTLNSLSRECGINLEDNDWPCVMAGALFRKLKAERDALRAVAKEVKGVAKPEFHDTSALGNDEEGDLVVRQPTLSQWKSIVHKAVKPHSHRRDKMSRAEKEFSEAWNSDLRLIDPDTSDVDWFHKRRALAEYVYLAGWKQAIESADAALANLFRNREPDPGSFASLEIATRGVIRKLDEQEGQ